LSTASPSVSVLLPVRNGAAFVREAVESVLAQTLSSLELIVVDDGSSDETPSVLASISDARLKVLRQAPRGLVEALNRGAAEARAPYLARMDADDGSLPRRLKLQVAVLEGDPAVGLVGCGIESMDPAGRALDSWLLPADDEALRRRLLLRNPFAHGSVVIRRRAFDDAGGYRSDYGANEDYDLWRRVAREWRIAAVPEVLYRYREHPEAVTKSGVGERVEARERLRDELWGEPALLRALRGERDHTERRALVHEALRRRRYVAALRATLP
jgi:glycosyltransferase involved in cell wall biosynthesis